MQRIISKHTIMRADVIAWFAKMSRQEKQKSERLQCAGKDIMGDVCNENGISVNQRYRVIQDLAILGWVSYLWKRSKPFPFHYNI